MVVSVVIKTFTNGIRWQESRVAPGNEQEQWVETTKKNNNNCQVAGNSEGKVGNKSERNQLGNNGPNQV